MKPSTVTETKKPATTDNLPAPELKHAQSMPNKKKSRANRMTADPVMLKKNAIEINKVLVVFIIFLSDRSFLAKIIIDLLFLEFNTI
jgi:hypothetical protein